MIYIYYILTMIYIYTIYLLYYIYYIHPLLYLKTLLFILFNNLHQLIPNSQSIPPQPDFEGFFFFKFLFLLALGLPRCIWAFSSCGKGRATLYHNAGFSLWQLLLLWNTGSRHAGFSNCGWRAPKCRLNTQA